MRVKKFLEYIREYNKPSVAGTYSGPVNPDNPIQKPVVDIIDKHPCPNWHKLNDEEKKLFKDPGPIGRGIRSKAGCPLWKDTLYSNAFFIFPKEDREKTMLEKIITLIENYTSSFGFIVDSLGQFKNKVAEFTGSGKKIKVLTIGSHGDENTLIMPMRNYQVGVIPDTDDYIDSIKQVIDKSSIVYFTACNGADKANGPLSEFAKKLGVSVYASKGVNFLGLASENGFVKCDKNGKCMNVEKPPISWVFPGPSPKLGWAYENIIKPMKGIWN